MSSAMGIMDSSASAQLMRHIFTTAITPNSSASKNIKTPTPKHSCTVSRSLVNRLMRVPTLFTW